MRIAILAWLLTACTATQACAQASDEIEAAVTAVVSASSGSAPTSMAWSVHRAPTDAAAPNGATPDSVEVYYNRQGESTAWRAWFGGRYFVHYDALGTYEVTDSIAVAYATLKKHRDAVELLELLEQVESAAKSMGVAVHE